MTHPLRRDLPMSAGALLATSGASAAAPSPDGAGLFDAYAHVVSPDRQRYAPQPLGGESLRPDTFADPVDGDRLIREMDAHGVARACVVHRGFVYGYDNSLVLDTVAAHRDRLSAVVVVDPLDARTPARVAALHKARAIAAVRIMGPRHDAQIDWIDAPATLKLWDVVADLGLPMNMELYPTNAAAGFARLVRLMARRPRALAIIDNLGFPKPDGPPAYGLDPAWDPLRDQPRILLKISSGLLLRIAAAGQSPAGFVRHAADRFGARRLIWGSDIGQTAVPYGELIRAGVDAAADLSEADRRSFLNDLGRRHFWR